MKKLNGNKYLDKFSKVSKECSCELINIFKDNGIKEMTFKEGENGMEYPVYIRIIQDDFGGVSEIELRKIKYKEDSSEPYLVAFGVDIDNETYAIYIDNLGGDGYDVEHSIGQIYKAVIDQIEFNKKNKK